MPEPGRSARIVRGQVRTAVRAQNQMMRTTHHEEFVRLLQQACSEAGIDLPRIDAQARLLTRRQLEKSPPPAPPPASAAQLAEARDGLRSWLDTYLERSAPIYRRFTGNPMIFLTEPTSVDIVADVTEPGMGGGSGSHVRRRASSTYSCAYDLAGTANRDNVFHPYLLVDSGDDQHVDNAASLSIVVHFSTPAPIEDWFLGERIWAPLMGYGEESYRPGRRSCWDHLTLGTGCVWDTMRYDVRVWQERLSWGDYDLSDPTDPDLDYVVLRRGCYRGGTEGDNEWAPRVEPIVFPAVNAFLYDAPGILLEGQDQNGHTVHVDVTITLDALSYYKGESLALDFRSPNWLSLPWVAIAGRHIRL